MDQMASSVGSLCYIDFKDPSDPVIEKVDFSLDTVGYSLCITDTKGSHADLTPDYAAVPAEMNAAAAVFGKEVLRDVSDEDIIRICNDKWKTYLFLTHNGFHTPKTFLTLDNTLAAINEGTLSFPVIVKPRFGCGSLAVSVAEDEEELRYCFRRNKDRIQKTYLKYESAAEEDNILVQQMLCGQEYGADIINDLTGQYQQTVVRKKIAMRAGETDIAQIVSEPVIEKDLERLGKLTRHIANMDCDVFLVNGVPYILEMNARFGGGYPFSHLAGCDLPKAIVEWAKGKTVPADMLKARTGITGFKELIITEGISDKNYEH